SLSLLQPPPSSQIYTLSLHDALPISSTLVMMSPRYTLPRRSRVVDRSPASSAWLPGLTVRISTPSIPSRRVQLSGATRTANPGRSEEHTSELQSRENLVCRLLLEKKK